MLWSQHSSLLTNLDCQFILRMYIHTYKILFCSERNISAKYPTSNKSVVNKKTPQNELIGNILCTKVNLLGRNSFYRKHQES